jgi:uncharacterized protein YndB with AHSA1/START domain
MEAVMSPATNRASSAAPQPLVISRSFAAPRALVFKAWSSADHVKRWFSPVGCEVPEAEVDFRPGGAFVVCMRLPDGQDFWSRGHFGEIAPPDRLTFTSAVIVGGDKKFTAHTTVTFADDGGGTRMTVHQAYDIHDENFRHAIEGSAEGWRTTLDKLEREVARLKTSEGRSVVHATFTLERTFDASPSRLFHALVDKAAKARWFGGGAGYVLLEREMDARPGGKERAKGRWASGVVSTFDALYFDVVANQRLVYTYEMHLDDRKISVSLATLEITPAGAGSRLTLTEQGAFLDGYDDAGSRERGTGSLLDRLAASLKE